MTTKISLTREQLDKLFKIVEQFDEIEWFTITEKHDSGIGPTHTVSFDLFNNENYDTKIDITDVGVW